MADQPKENKYSKQPVWVWVVVYIIAAAVIYGAVYYLFLRGTGSSY